MNYLNRVRVTVATIGQGDVTAGAAYSASTFNFTEAGAVSGATYPYILTEGNDFEIGSGVATFASGSWSVTRNVRASKIGGVVGTTKMTLGGNAVLTIDFAAQDLDNFVDASDPPTARSRLQVASYEAMQSANMLGYCCGAEVSQFRGQDSSYSMPNAAYSYICDGIQVYSNIAAGTILTAYQGGSALGTPPAGFSRWVGIASPSAITLGANDNAGLVARLEGYRLSRAGWGTAAARPVKIGFWVRATVPGTYSLAIYNPALGRMLTTPYTISASNLAEWKTFTIPGDTSGTWLTGNAAALEIYLVAAAGSSKQGAPLNTWGAYGTAFAATGQANPFNATGSGLFATGFCLMHGNDDIPAYRSPYLVLPFERALLECQRYYEKAYAPDVAPGTVAPATGGSLTWQVPSNSVSAFQVYGNVQMRTKRAQPTVSVFGINGTSGSVSNGVSGADIGTGSAEVINLGFASFAVRNSSAGTVTTANNSVFCYWVADARM